MYIPSTSLDLRLTGLNHAEWTRQSGRTRSKPITNAIPFQKKIPNLQFPSNGIASLPIKLFYTSEQDLSHHTSLIIISLVSTSLNLSDPAKKQNVQVKRHPKKNQTWISNAPR